MAEFGNSVSRSVEVQAKREREKGGCSAKETDTHSKLSHTNKQHGPLKVGSCWERRQRERQREWERERERKSRLWVLTDR